MDKGTDYRITKLEKSPLQRFKNQNMLTKKFGKPGTQVYQAITGKRTSSAISGDLEIDRELFDEILAYMEESGMVQLDAVGPSPAKKTAAKEISAEPESVSEQKEERDKSNEIEPIEAPDTKEIESEEAVPEIPKKKPEDKKLSTLDFEKEIEPIESPETEIDREEIVPETEEQPRKKSPEKPEIKEEPEFEINEEITPIEETAEREAEQEPEEENEREEKHKEEREEEPVQEEEKEREPTEEPAQEKEMEEAPEEEKEEIQIEEEKIAPVSEHEEEEEGLSPVEKIIKEKYGDVGIKVYTLIDGQRTAEEIMKQTGLSESKLVEVLDFMDDEGIIKLEYPGEKKKAAPVEQKPTTQEKEGFNLLVEESGEASEKLKDNNPIEVPVRAPLNMVETLYVKSKILLKFGDKGGKVFESINGKTDVLEIALKNQVHIYEIVAMINFLLEQKAILLKPLSRAEIRKKYGDEGYSVYKVYGKEGVMLYELVDKDMRIKEMAKYLYADVPANKDKLSEMFLFIHQILKIDLPVDKDLLRREFESV